MARDGWVQLHACTVNPEQRLVRRPDGQGGLTSLEGRLLRYLIDRAGTTVPTHDLLRDVWGYAETADTRAVHHAVQRTRKKIEADPASPRTLFTETRIGYRLELPTEGAEDPLVERLRGERVVQLVGERPGTTIRAKTVARRFAPALWLDVAALPRSRPLLDLLFEELAVPGPFLPDVALRSLRATSSRLVVLDQADARAADVAQLLGLLDSGVRILIVARAAIVAGIAVERNENPTVAAPALLSPRDDRTVRYLACLPDGFPPGFLEQWLSGSEARATVEALVADGWVERSASGRLRLLHVLVPGADEERTVLGALGTLCRRESTRLWAERHNLVHAADRFEALAAFEESASLCALVLALQSGTLVESEARRVERLSGRLQPATTFGLRVLLARAWVRLARVADAGLELDGLGEAPSQHLAHLCLAKAELALATRDLDACDHWCDRGLEARPSPPVRGALLTARSLRQALSNDLGGCMATLNEAQAVVPPGMRERWNVLSSLGQIHLRLGDPRAGLPYAERVADEAASAGDGPVELREQGFVAVMLANLGDRARAREISLAVLGRLRDLGHEGFAGPATLNLAALDLEDGHLEQAKSGLDVLLLTHDRDMSPRIHQAASLLAGIALDPRRDAARVDALLEGACRGDPEFVFLGTVMKRLVAAVRGEHPGPLEVDRTRLPYHDAVVALANAAMRADWPAVDAAVEPFLDRIAVVRIVDQWIRRWLRPPTT